MEYTNKSEWVAAVGPFATIHFGEVPKFTFVTDEYESLGVQFPDGNDQVDFDSSHLLYHDGWGLDGNGDIDVAFDADRAWIGVDHPGSIKLQLFRRGRLVFDGPSHFTSGTGFFVGVSSTEPFDAARFLNPNGGERSIDDLHFQPAPCTGDLDEDAIVGPEDLAALLTAWGAGPGGSGDLDGDGVVGIRDLLTLLAAWGTCPHFTDCDGNGAWDYADIHDGTSPDCNGNGIPDTCDLAAGHSSDLDGDGVPDECQAPSNDECDSPATITDGETTFLTVAATTGGPFVICDEGTFVFERDVWYHYTAPCSGTATLSTCGAAGFDTRLAVYFAGACRVPLNPLACSDDAPGCEATAEVQVEVFEGIDYLVRLGGGAAEPAGYGVLSVSCSPP